MPTTDPDPALTNHIEALYALACVLVGTDEADTLIEHVYEYAADVPPAERPADERGWLFGLMIDAQEGNLHPAGAQVHPESNTSFTNDPFRREIAQQTARRMLPAAFAACSIHERFLLAIDVLGEPSDEILATALDTSPTNARSIRDRARSALRASLRDVLKGPERMLVDVGLPDEALRNHLSTLLVDRFQPAPASLQATVADILARARADRRETRNAQEAAAAEPRWAVRSLLDRGLELAQRWFSLRGLIGGLAFLIVVVAGIGGASYLFSPSSSSTPPPSVVDLSVEHADRVRVTRPIRSSRKATAYIQQTWGRRVSVPTIENASLRGIGRLTLPPDLEVPVLIYGEGDGSKILAFAFNYALMDRLGGRARLEREVRTKLAASDAVLAEQRSNRAVVLGRQRDEIFVIVAPDTQADTLRTRVRL